MKPEQSRSTFQESVKEEIHKAFSKISAIEASHDVREAIMKDCAERIVFIAQWYASRGLEQFRG